MSAGRQVNTLSQSWGTPEKYVAAVKRVFGGEIDLDPCSNSFSIVGATTEYRLPDQDGLKEPWDFPRIFVNPPYGRDKERGTSIRDWLARCEVADERGSQVIALVPVATNTTHWKRHVFPCAASICFLADTRLKFLVDGQSGGKGAPMACAMVYWGGNPTGFDYEFKNHGVITKFSS